MELSIFYQVKSPLIVTKSNENFQIFQDPKLRKLNEESEIIREEFEKYFDMEVIYEDLDPAFIKVKEALKKLSSDTQWVPRNWVYS